MYSSLFYQWNYGTSLLKKNYLLKIYFNSMYFVETDDFILTVKMFLLSKHVYIRFQNSTCPHSF